jgi:tripartite-type tricarboxylate transporter receptor subunit TctC
MRRRSQITWAAFCPARTPQDRQVFEFLFAPQDMGRLFFAPPAVPPERVAALRDAFERTLQDAQFLAEADRLGLEVLHGGGDAIDRLLERLYATSPSVIERVKAIAE